MPASETYEKGVLRMLRYVCNQMERCRNADFDKLGITSSQASVMLYLFKNRTIDVTQQSIQSTLMLSHPTITGLMQRLELKGLISRSSNPKDCRCKFVQLTPKGGHIERELKSNLRTMEEKALVGLDQKELVIFDHCLKTIAANLKQDEDSIKAHRILDEMQGHVA